MKISQTIRPFRHSKGIATNLYNYFRSQTVLFVAMIAMLITCIFVPVDNKYLGYFDFKTLACLFTTLAVVGAFKRIHIFEIIGQKIVTRFSNLRSAVIALTFTTYFGSMLLANDMALLTFLPLSFYVLNSTDKKEIMAFTFIMQNIAANLGGMITPFGNPQNLYLYSYYNISNSEFFRIMSVPFITATVLIIICCMFVKKEPIELKDKNEYPVEKKRIAVYSALFVMAVMTVFRIVPYIVSTLFIAGMLFILDRKSLGEVNYSLLMTFCVFFVFAGNMARIPAVQSFFKSLIPLNPLLVGIISCQGISNVPSSILLSKFTNDYQSLLVAVNIGGLGTLIASLASLITYSEFNSHQPEKSESYIKMFSLINFSFLIILYFVVRIVRFI